MVAWGRPAIPVKIALVYVFAGAAGPQYDDYALRFLNSYHANPPGIEHDSVVVLNGTKQTGEIACLFSPLRHCSFLTHDNSGYDIGAFQLAAKETPCDLMVFFGASTFFHRPGWLIRMANAFNQLGNAQYGAMGNQGVSIHNVWPHVRTTAFWMNPKLMNEYPHRVTRADQRYAFEHSATCLTEWLKQRGIRSWVVTWESILPCHQCDSDPNGFHHGNQRNLLAGDRLCEPPYYAAP